MGENNRCIRCGKPCGPNETMCDECRAWFQGQTGSANGKVKIQPKEPSTESKPPKEAKEKVRFSKKMMIVSGVILLAVILLVAIVFAFKGKKADTSGGESGNRQEPGQDEMMRSDQETEEKIWEAADIDAAEEKICTLHGTVEGKELKLDQAMSFYLNDETGQKYFFKKAEYIALEDKFGEFSLDRKNSRQVEVTGTLTCAENVIYLELSTLETTDGLPEEEGREDGIHSYEFVVRDCSWHEAFWDSQERGGYLVRINSQEEYDYLLQKIQEQELGSVHFYLGGRRHTEGYEYFWADENNQLYGEVLNSAQAWCARQWFDGEPSYEDPTIHVQEEYLNMFYLKREERFVWVDVPDDIPAVVPAFSGKVGYIVEYED